MFDRAGDLALALDLSRPPDLATEAEGLLVEWGLASSLTIWIADLASETLSDLSGRLGRRPLDGAHRQVFESREPLREGRRTFLQLGRRGQTLGVLEIEPSTAADPDQLAPLSVLIANALWATNMVSDVYARGRRAEMLSLAATIQHRNLPFDGYLDASYDIGARLEPAFHIAGDVVDFAVNPEGVHLALFDAVGHGLRSTTLSSWAVATYRLLRRKNASLPEIVEEIDQVIAVNGRDREFVTGVIFTLRDGEWELFNAGHPAPLLVDSDAVNFLNSASTQLPFGLGPDSIGVTRGNLDKGEMVLIYSDGVTGVRAPTLEFWGEARLTQLARQAQRSDGTMSAFCRHLLSEVMKWADASLADDASIIGLRRR